VWGVDTAHLAQAVQELAWAHSRGLAFGMGQEMDVLSLHHWNMKF